jgi:collagen triple helix repeat protein
MGLGAIAIALGVIAIVLGGSAVGIALTHAGPTGATGVPGARGSTGTNGINGTNGKNGINGTNGSQGAPGVPAAKLWAVVTGAGAILLSSGVITAGENATATYAVEFNQSITSCAIVVSLAGPSAGSATWQYIGGAGGAAWARVYTWSASGAATASSFSIAVLC